MSATDAETVTPPTAPAPDDFASQIAEQVASESSREEGPKKRGRPAGTRNKKKEAPAFTYTKVAGEAEMYGNLFATIWGFIAPIAKVAPLTPAQIEQAGEAFAPLGQKYMPLLGAWQYEIAAVIAIGAIAIEAKRNYVPPKSAEEIAADREVPAVKRDPFNRVAA